jgi:DNA-binding MarR family transcriptional regulator
MTQLVEHELAADGVSADGYAMLSLIGVRQPVRLTELANDLGLPLTTASDVVRRLETRRYVRRHENPADARSWLFELSPAGAREWKRGFGALQRINARLERELGSDAAIREALIGLDSAFAAALTDV